MANTENPTTAKCNRCGRTLRSAKSIARGYGPTCTSKIAKAAKIATEKPAQVTKALELIELNAIVPVKGRTVFRSISSDGTRTYLTAATGQCTCPAGLKSRQCYHGLAASLIAA